MKKILFLLLAFALIFSCSCSASLTEVPVETAETVEKNTEKA